MKDMVSIIIPVFNEGKTITRSVERIAKIVSAIPHEFILVDDGSTDNSWTELAALSLLYENVVSIKLSRNFGKEGALFAGIDAVKGDCCVCIDADMQHPPELILEMYRLWKQEGFLVVEGVKSSRGKESLLYKTSANLFYNIFKKVSKIDLRNASDFRLMDKSAIEALMSMTENQTFFRGMSSWIGFKRTQVFFEVQNREEGNSKWSLSRLVQLLINAITSFSAVPLYISFVAGCIFFLFFLILFVQTIYMKILGFSESGFTTVIILQLIIGSVLMMSIGLVGIYIEKIFQEVKRRPRYIIQQKLNGGNYEDV